MKNWRWKLGRILPYVILAIIAICFLLPLLWVVVASFDPSASQTLKLPEGVTLNNYLDVMSNTNYLRSFGNGLFIALGQGILVVVAAGFAAYPLSRYEMRYNKMLMYTILFMTALPITAVMVPVYQLFNMGNLLDNLGTVMLFMAAASLPYGIWMMKNFMDAVPLELEEAAWVDGATTMQTITRIVAPLMFPGICVVFIWTFSGSWGNFFVPYILLMTPSKFPASYQLYTFIGQYGDIAYGSLAAYSVIYTAPAIILYVISQKYMSQGFTMSGAAKG